MHDFVRGGLGTNTRKTGPLSWSLYTAGEKESLGTGPKSEPTPATGQGMDIGPTGGGRGLLGGIIRKRV